MKGYLDAKELESYKKEDLQELAKQLGVDAEGTKKEIAARCAAVEVDIPDKSYDALKMRLALSVEYNTAPEVSETDTDGAESEV